MVYERVRELIGYFFKHTPIRFAFVGALGTVVALVVTRILYFLLPFKQGVWLQVPVVLGFETSVLHNFMWHEHWTFKKRYGGGWVSRVKRFIYYNVASIGSYATQGVCVQVLTGVYGWDISVSQFIGIVLGFLLNYTVSRKAIWRSGAEHI